MSGTSPSRSTVDIKTTAEKHSQSLQDLMLAHSLTGCDTVSCMWAIKKSYSGEGAEVWNHQAQVKLSARANHRCGSKTTQFIAACYGFPGETNMNSRRYVDTKCGLQR